jgi:endonuclease YncB( thermonuclease family)
MLRTLLIILAALVPAFQFSESVAAERKKWEMLTDCQYVEDKNNDGDNFRVKCGEKDFVLRLYFVDAPETNLRYTERTREQSEHFGVTLEETMKAGVKATGTVRETLKGRFIVWTRWAGAAGRGKEVRYYGLVEVRGKSLVEILVSNGLARTKGVTANLPTGEKSKVYIEKLHALEAEAEKRQIGVWARSTK